MYVSMNAWILYYRESIFICVDASFHSPPLTSNWICAAWKIQVDLHNQETPVRLVIRIRKSNFLMPTRANEMTQLWQSIRVITTKEEIFLLNTQNANLTERSRVLVLSGWELWAWVAGCSAGRSAVLPWVRALKGSWERDFCSSSIERCMRKGFQGHVKFLTKRGKQRG